MREQYEVLRIRAGYSNTARISFIATDDQCGSIHLGLHCAVAPCWRELCKFARDKTGNVPLWSRLVPYLGVGRHLAARIRCGLSPLLRTFAEKPRNVRNGSIGSDQRSHASPDVGFTSRSVQIPPRRKVT